MGANNDEGRTSLELAKERAILDTQEALSRNQYSIYTTSAPPTALNPTPLSQPEAISLVKKIGLHFDEDKLTHQVEQLRQTGSFHEVWVYSDRSWKKPDETYPDSQKEKFTRTRFSTVVTDQERSRYSNIWISNFVIREAITPMNPF